VKDIGSSQIGQVVSGDLQMLGTFSVGKHLLLLFAYLPIAVICEQISRGIRLDASYNHFYVEMNATFDFWLCLDFLSTLLLTPPPFRS